MPRPSPVTTILLRECAGTGLAVAGFTYSSWITLILLTNLITHLTHPTQIHLGHHALLATLDCLTWWTGVAGLRLGGWRTKKATTLGLALPAIHAATLPLLALAKHHPA
ncbi:hypothetical protein [Actinopolyspora mortivallis]|uniref:Uncharacterized protein n=1 Tax=Actinopolyspora mortivallis TaxID=33906 RepID=A0A2T0GRF6_ACTMO|nr:hypothetical protein [Actinopolyspora mortivallis]PRW61689.1 hypothetical protein CEP50_19425 [Actinopolyspora mortivallis]